MMTSKWKTGFLGTVLAAMICLGILGCEQEGPAERAGEEIDEAVEDAGEAIEEAGDAVREGTN